MKKFRFLFIAAIFLTLALLVKTWALSHPQPWFYGLTFEDIMLKLPYANSKVTPIPYFEGYVEYPVITGLFVWLTAWLSSGTGFFVLSGIILSLGLLGGLGVLEGLGVGEKRLRALVFLSPTIFLFTAYNWDSLAVLFSCLAFYFYRQRKFSLGAIFLALGASTKLYPAFFLIPFLIWEIGGVGGIRGIRRIRGVIKNILVFVGVSLAVNLPFMIGAFEGWSVFMKFSSARGPNIDSIWAGIWKVSQGFLGGESLLKTTNFASGLAFLGGYLWLMIRLMGLIGRNRGNEKDNVLLVCLLAVLWFVFTNKVYSPPYNLWFLPLFALLPQINLKKILAFEWANGFVYWAVFQYFYQTNILGKAVLDFPWYKITYFGVLVRHLFLLLLLTDLLVGFKKLKVKSEK